MGTILKFEAERLFFTKKNAIILLFITLISVYVVFQGVWAYKNFDTTQNAFQEFEKSKIQSYSNWDQYGGMGFEVILKPSPLTIFFYNSVLFDNLAANIDVQEIIKIYSSRKGTYLFDKGQSKDLAGILSIFGSLYMLFMGLANFRTDRFINYAFKGKRILLSIFSRLLWLNLFFLFLLLLGFLIVRFNGIAFSALHLKVLLAYGLYLTAFLSSFYALGLLVGCSIKSNRLILSFFLWFAFIFIAPQINNMHLMTEASLIPPKESVDIKKLEELMAFESEVRTQLIEKLKNGIDTDGINEFYHENVLRYMNDGYIINKKLESDYSGKIKQIIMAEERSVALLPFIFHSFLAQEFSSKGFLSYIDFIDYIDVTRDKFYDYYIRSRYEKFGQKPESFVKSDENLFQAESRLPGNYYAGLGVTVLYSLILLGISFFVLRRRMNEIPEDVKRPELTLQEGRSYFMFFREAAYRDSTFENYIRQENVSGIDRVEIEDIDFEINPRAAVKLISSIRGTDEGEVLEYLEIMGVSQQELNAKRNTPGLLRKIYAASQIGDGEIIVINEFLKDLPRAFEKDFLKLVKELKSRGKMIIYLSIQFLDLGIDEKESLKENVPNYRYIEVAIEDAGLR